MACTVNGATIILSGDVGDMGWYFDDDRGFTASDVIGALAQVGDRTDVTIRLNSGGGIATEGSAIHAALARHKGRKTVVVEGIAASAASVLAMAGDEVVMSLGALLMIHDPSGYTIGTVVEHQQQINALTALADAMSTIYAAKSGMTAEACRADMQAELWMTADQAVAKGYANRVETPADDLPQPAEPAPFNYTAYAHAPARMVALARAKHWDRDRTKPVAPAAPLTLEHEAIMPTKEEIQARIDAALAADREKNKTAAAAAAVVSDPVGAAATAVSRSDAAAIAKACVDAGVPGMTASLLAEGATLAQATAKIGAAGRIKDMVALARQTNSSIPAELADAMIAQGKTVEQATAALFDQMVARGAGSSDEGMRTMHRSGAGGSDQPGGAASDSVARSRADMVAQVKRDGMIPNV